MNFKQYIYMSTKSLPYKYKQISKQNNVEKEILQQEAVNFDKIYYCDKEKLLFNILMHLNRNQNQSNHKITKKYGISGGRR